MASADVFHTDEPEIPESDPFRKYILLVLRQAQTDNATELTIGRAEPTGVHVRFKVDGHWYSFTPFPAKLRPDVVRQLQTMAGIVGEAREGTLDETAGTLRLKWTVRVTTPDEELILIPQLSTP
jgi:type II secretory ATPase GspE/PulE/Tfp pilus assembly ATPase PilB-like protein